MFLSLCGVAVACTVSGHSAKVVDATAAIQSPPRVIAIEEVQEQAVTRPNVTHHHVIHHHVIHHHWRSARRNPPVRMYQSQETGCAVYNCIGPQTSFRLPHEIPYAEYQQQFHRLPPGG